MQVSIDGDLASFVERHQVAHDGDQTFARRLNREDRQLIWSGWVGGKTKVRISQFDFGANFRSELPTPKLSLT